MFRQYYAQRFRSMFPPKATKNGRKTVYVADPRDRRVGTIPVGTILYIQDHISPLGGLRHDGVCRDPWIVEAWLPREFTRWDSSTRQFRTVYLRGGHLAVVRSLRNRSRVQKVADWILLACADAGLEKLC